VIAAGQKTFENQCSACHTIGSGDRTGPDLKHVDKRRDRDWLVKWLEDPVAMGETDHIGRSVSAKYGGVIMPNPRLSKAQIDEVLAFLTDASQKGGFQSPKQPARKLAGAELERAKTIYFDRCAGCHGSQRQGATGPELTADRTQKLGTAELRATLNHGRPGGMPNWGELGILSNDDVELLAHYLQMPPSARPSLSFEEIKKSWNLKVPLKDRPTKPKHPRNWKNFFAVVMSGPGKLAIIDGDWKHKLSLIDIGFAVDRVRASASGRYLYVLGRDGRVSLVDLFMDPPTIVAQARGCFDARAFATSKHPMFGDKLVVEGCYWPSQAVIFDGATLEPKAVHPLSEPNAREARVGAIVAPRSSPTWALSLMEPGVVAVIDYSKPRYPISARIPAAPELADGALDQTGRYFLAPSPAKNELVVVDLLDKSLVTKVEMGKSPHLDPGARFEDPELGWVTVVPHVGEGKLLFVGADPKKHSDQAWKVVREVTGIPAGGLFAATHPKSPWIWVDSPANAKLELSRQVCVVSKKSAKVEKCFKPRETGRVMDFQYNQDGSEVWISGWSDRGGIVIYDDVNLKEIKRIESDWVASPTRKINAYNDANDVY